VRPAKRLPVTPVTTPATSATGCSDCTVRVRYADTDQMSVVYYANYYIYFEVGRVEYMRERGVDYKDMEKQDDAFIVVAESHCRYLRPARYDDLLRIRTRVEEVRRRTIRFAYEVHCDARGELLATGETLHVVCDRHGRPKALPEKYCRIFESLEAPPGVEGSEK
jgi:acyl-CoA thioester hydrolase